MPPLTFLGPVNTGDTYEAKDGFKKTGFSDTSFLLAGGGTALVSNFAIAADYYTKAQLQASGQAQVNWGNLTDIPATFPATAHNHDDRYYTEAESNTKFVPYTGAIGNLDLGNYNLFSKNIKTTGTIFNGVYSPIVIETYDNYEKNSILLKVPFQGMGGFKVKIWSYYVGTTGKEFFEFFISNYRYNNGYHFPEVTWIAGDSNRVQKVEFLKDSNGLYFINIVVHTSYPRVAITDCMMDDSFPTEITKRENWGITFNTPITGLIKEHEKVPADFRRDNFLINKIDNLKIGGRNYILNSNQVVDTTNVVYFAVSPDFPKDKVRNKTLVLSCDYYSKDVVWNTNPNVNHRFFFELAIQYTDSTVQYVTIQVTDTADKNERLFNKFKTLDKEIQQFNFFVAYVQNIDSGEIIAKNFKLEIGDIGSDWSPAPEDQVSDWNQTNPLSLGFIKNKPPIPTIPTNNIIGNGTSNYLPKFNGNNSLTNSSIIDTGTAIGYGIATPRTTVDIVASNSKIRVANNVSNQGQVGYEFSHAQSLTSEVKAAIISKAGGSWGKSNIHFVLNGTSDSSNYNIDTDTRMIIHANSNIGINTNALPEPTEKLHVVGNVLATGYKTPGGTSSGFLKANGSIDINTYLTSSSLAGYATENYVSTAISNLNLPGTYAPLIHAHSWSQITDKPAFATVATTGNYNDLIDKPTSLPPTTHVHVISDVTGLQGALDSKEPLIGTKNTAFNKDFGTILGTVAHGNHTHNYSELDGKPDLTQFINKTTEQEITGLKKIRRGFSANAGWGNTKNITDYSFILETDPGAAMATSRSVSIGFNLLDGTYGVQAGIYFKANVGNGTHMAFATTDLFNDGPKIAMSINHLGVVNFERALPTFQGGNLATQSWVANNYYTKTQLQTSGEALVHWDNITGEPVVFPPSNHSHAVGDVTGLQDALNGKVDDSQVLTNVPAGAVFTDTLYNEGTGLELNGTTFSIKQDVLDDIILGKEAHNWGNHAAVGYLTGFNEQDPTVPTWVKSITQANIAEWQGKVNRTGDTITGNLLFTPVGNPTPVIELKTDNGGGRNDIYLRSDNGSVVHRVSVEDNGYFTWSLGPIGMGNGTGFDYFQMPAWNSQFRMGFFATQVPGYMFAISGSGYFGGDIYSVGYSRSDSGFVHQGYYDPNALLTSDGGVAYAEVDVINDGGELRIQPAEITSIGNAINCVIFKHKLVYIRVIDGNKIVLNDPQQGQRFILFNVGDYGSEVEINSSSVGKLEAFTKISLYITNAGEYIFYDKGEISIGGFN